MRVGRADADTTGGTASNRYAVDEGFALCGLVRLSWQAEGAERNAVASAPQVERGAEATA